MNEQCLNCEYFVQHYAISKLQHIHKVNNGHCKLHIGRSLKRKLSCTDFKPATDRFDEKVCNIFSVYMSIERRLGAIHDKITKTVQNLDENIKNLTIEK